MRSPPTRRRGSSPPSGISASWACECRPAPSWFKRGDGGPVSEALLALHQEVNACVRCALSGTRTHAVPGAGDPNARIMIVGEAPGQNEDQQGLPFVGAAGQLLNQLLAGIGLR